MRKIQPNNLEIEKTILCNMLLNNDLILNCDLEKEDFYSFEHQIIFQAMKKLKAFDINLLTHEVIKDNILPDYILDLAIVTLSDAYFEDHCKKIKELSICRQIIVKANKIQALAYDEKALHSDIAELVSISTNTNTKKKSMLELIVEDIDQDVKDDYIWCFWYDFLDDTIWGIFATNIVVIAWPTSHWKSSLAMNIINKIIKTQKVSLHSLEVSAKEVWRLLISLNTWYGVSRQRNLTDDEKGIISNKIADISDSLTNINVYSNSQLDKIINQIRKDTLDWVRIHFVDHIGLVRTTEKNKTTALQQVTNGLKSLAMELNICIVELCQINRDWSKDLEIAGIELYHLKQSWSIEEDANIAMLIHRTPHDERYDNLHIKIAKNRYGAKLEWRLYFHKSSQFISVNVKQWS